MSALLEAYLLPRLWTGMLIGGRVGGALLIGPFWGSEFFPVPVRVLFVVLFSAVLTAALPVPAALQVGEPSALWLAALLTKELLVGVALGMVARLITAAVETAAQLVSTQIGLSMATVFDPVAQTPVALLGNALTMFAIGVLLACDGHQQILLALKGSLQLVPVEQLLPLPLLSAGLVRGFGEMLVLSLQIAAPVLVAVFLVNIGLAVLARTAPQLNVFVVGLLVTVVVGLVVLALQLPGLGVLLQTRFAGLAPAMLGVLR